MLIRCLSDVGLYYIYLPENLENIFFLLLHCFWKQENFVVSWFMFQHHNLTFDNISSANRRITSTIRYKYKYLNFLVLTATYYSKEKK